MKIQKSMKMVSEKETAVIRRFVVTQLRDKPDLSTLTFGMLKKRYLASVKRESLSPEARKFMKQVVEEELIKMQENNTSESESEVQKPEKKRKREQEDEEVGSEEEKRNRGKKSRSCISESSSEEEEDCNTGSPEQKKSLSNDPKQAVKKSDPKRGGSAKRKIDSDSADEETNGSENSGSESDSPEEAVKENANAPKNGETRSVNSSGGKKRPESESDSDNETKKSSKVNENESSDTEKEKKNDDSDSDSSSLPLEEEKNNGQEETRDDKKKKKKKKTKKDKSSRDQKGDNKAIVRLKRYISLCGVRKNYKKLLDGCRSTKSRVAVLKKELEDLGVGERPTVQKCKRVRMKKEEAQELADLDVENIITTEGRSKRRRTSARQDQKDPSSSTYQRTLNSGSDSNEENDRGRRRVSEWANLQGIISDDADSD